MSTTTRRWTIKEADGNLSTVHLATTKRNLERSLLPEYTGHESEWDHGYAIRFAADLRELLESEEMQIVRVEMTLTEIKN